MILRVTGLRGPCVKIRRLGNGLQEAVTMRSENFAFMKGAVMAVVVAGGKVSPGECYSVCSSRQGLQKLFSRYKSRGRSLCVGAE